MRLFLHLSICNLYKIKSAVREESEGSRRGCSKDTVLPVYVRTLLVTCITILATTRKRKPLLGPHKYSNTRQYLLKKVPTTEKAWMSVSDVLWKPLVAFQVWKSIREPLCVTDIGKKKKKHLWNENRDLLLAQGRWRKKNCV